MDRTQLTVHARVPRYRAASLRDLVRQASNPRFVILALALLTYVWRFQELSSLLTPLRLSAVATVGLWLFVLVQPRPAQLRRAMRMRGLPLILAFILWMLVSLGFGLDPARSYDDWTAVHLKNFTLLLFVAASASSLDNIKRMMAIHVIGAAVLAAFYVKSGFPLWGTPVTTYDVNDLAVHLNMTIPMALYFIISTKHKFVRIGLWVLVGTFAVCVLMTQSRGGFLTLGVLSIVVIAKMKGASLLVRIMPFVLLTSAYPLLPEATRARLETLFSPSSDYNMDAEEGRIEIWKRGMGYLRKYPVTGVGVHNFVIAERMLSPRAQEAEVRGQVSHNSFVEVATETGIPGIVMYISTLAVAVLTAFRLANRHSKESTEYGRDAGKIANALGLSTLSFCVGGFFLSLAHMALLMTLIAMNAGLYAVMSRHRGGLGHSPEPRVART